MKTKYIKVAFEECKKGAKAISYKPIMASNLASYDKEIIHLIEVPDHEAELVDEIRTSIDQLEVYISELEEDDKYWYLVNIMKKEIEVLKESLIQKLKSDE